MCAKRINGPQGLGACGGACLDLSASRRGWSASTLWHAHTQYWTSFRCCVLATPPHLRAQRLIRSREQASLFTEALAPVSIRGAYPGWWASRRGSSASTRGSSANSLRQARTAYYNKAVTNARLNPDRSPSTGAPGRQT